MQPKTLRARPGQRCSPATFRLIRPPSAACRPGSCELPIYVWQLHNTSPKSEKGVRSGNPSLLGSIRAEFRICRPLAGCFAVCSDRGTKRGLDRGQRKNPRTPGQDAVRSGLLATAKQLVRRGMLLGAPPLANSAPVAVPSRLSAPRHQTTLARPEPLRSPTHR